MWVGLEIQSTSRIPRPTDVMDCEAVICAVYVTTVMAAGLVGTFKTSEGME